MQPWYDHACPVSPDMRDLIGLRSHYSTMVYDCNMDEKKKKRLTAQASRETKKALASAMEGLVEIDKMKKANPGIGFIIPRKQEAQLKRFVYDYRNSWNKPTPVKGVKKKGK